MLYYNHDLKTNSRDLRSNMTDAEKWLWLHIRKKQILGIQFYRQKPIGPYIVDFYAPATKLVIEVDGAHHLTEEYLAKDKERDAYMKAENLNVLRFDNGQVLQETVVVIKEIFNEIMLLKNPPASLTLSNPLFQSG